jgi:predicted phage tail protein
MDVTYPTTNKVRLYGHLGKKFGRVYDLTVRSPIEAVHALGILLPGFRQHVIANSEPGYHVYVGNEIITEEQYKYGYPAGNRIIKIVPVLHGAGGNGITGIIVGVALIAFGVMTGGAGLGVAAAYGAGAAGTAGAGFAVGGVAGGLIAAAGSIAFTMGVSMVIGGLVNAIFKPPKPPGPADRPENKPSYAYNGPVNTMAQGNVVPLCYGGPILIGSQVVSVGFSTEEMPIDPSEGGGGGSNTPRVKTQVTEDHTIPSEGPYSIQLTSSGIFQWVDSVVHDQGGGVTVAFNNAGQGMTPQPGEFALSDTVTGLVRFDNEDGGKPVRITYTHEV